MKAGTTALMECMQDCEEIFMPPKELHFFNNDNNYKRGIEWYAKQFKNVSGEIAIGEKTPTYSYLPNVPNRIYKYIPQAKLIWIFREPVIRAYSNYWHYVINGIEHFDFESAIYREEERLKEDFFKGYRKRSIYIEQVRRFLRYFPKDKMLFILFENFVCDPQSIFEQVFKFLGVSTTESLTMNKAGATRLPRSKKLAYISRKLFGDTLLFKLIRKVNHKSIEGYPPMKEETKLYLKKYFKEYNEQLAELIEKDLSVWDNL